MRKKFLLSAIGAGVSYLMRNKQARDKLLRGVKSLAAKRSGKIGK